MSFMPRTIAELAEEWPADLDHFSASSAKMAVRCPEQWRRRYVHGEKNPPGLSLIAGKADHAAIELSMQQKIESYADLPMPEVKGTYVSVVEREVDRAGGLNELEWKNDVDTQAARVRAYDEVRVAGQDVVGCYHTIVSPTLQPVAVERKFEQRLPGIPVPVIGYIDLIAGDVPQSIFNQAAVELGQDTYPENKRLIDRKRRTRRTTKIEAEWSIQADVYQLIEPLPFEFQISVTTKTPQVLVNEPDLMKAVPPVDRSLRQLQHIVGSIGFYYSKYGPDEPWPAGGKLHPWACNYCGFRDTCWGWAT